MKKDLRNKPRTRINSMRGRLIVILGPTASGKSELAVKLAKKFNGQIVSADSRQIYQGMDIGTAKTKKAALVDIVKPNQKFTLAQYKRLAIGAIKDIQKRGKLPFLVGGTGLYIQAIVDNLVIPKVKPDKKIRNRLEKLSNQKLWQQLGKIDPLTAKTIDHNNKRRLIRALEVCLKTKKPFSQQREKGHSLFDVCQIGLKTNKKNLDKKIDQRVEKMFKAGLIKEVKGLIKKYGWQPYSMSSIGYQEIIQSTNAKELIKLHTRQYAKRQMTWFKKDKRINWVRNYQEAAKLIRNFLL